MKLLYVTDLHGDRAKYRRTLEMAVERGITVIVNGGDLLPKHGDRHREQPQFIRGFLREHFQELEARGIRLITLPGNDDLQALDGLFDEVCGEFELVHNIAGRKVTVDGYEFIGLDRILDHPFGCKDRVVAETRYLPQQQLSPVASLSREQGYDWIWDWADYYHTELPLMCEVLDRLPRPEHPEKAVYLMHMPPAGMHLGQLRYQDRDIGSFDIYDFLKERQPLFSLHGHIHESPDTEQGTWVNRLLKTICIQPGQTERGDDQMACVEIDLASGAFERRVVGV